MKVCWVFDASTQLRSVVDGLTMKLNPLGYRSKCVLGNDKLAGGRELNLTSRGAQMRDGHPRLCNQPLITRVCGDLSSSFTADKKGAIKLLPFSMSIRACHNDNTF